MKLNKNFVMAIVMGVAALTITNAKIAKADVFYELSQTVTGYTGSGYTASGKTPKIGYVAVHPKEPIRYPGDLRALNPVIPFGTMITILNNNPIPTPTGPRSIFYVEDTGDTDYARYNAGKLTYRWIDVYCGASTASNIAFANTNLDAITRSYMWEN